MRKQHLEGILSRTLKEYSKQNRVWWMKIQSNLLSHKNTPADFIVITKTNNILIECKESKVEYFYFERLTQRVELEMFQGVLKQNKSYILICFWDKNTKGSDIYLLNIDVYNNIVENISKKSITKKEACIMLKDYRVGVKNTLLNIDSIILSDI